MWTRRRFLTRSGLALAGAGTCFAFPGDEGPGPRDGLPDGSAARGMVTPQTDQAVERGLSYLASKQHRDGSWGTNFYTGNTGITSLGALAFMASGHQPNRGPYGPLVVSAL